jgi:hypothetical protein
MKNVRTPFKINSPFKQEDPIKNKTVSSGQGNVGGNLYNTRTEKTVSRTEAIAEKTKAQGVKKSASAGSPKFNAAFAAARKSKKSEFSFGGKKYKTNIAKKEAPKKEEPKKETPKAGSETTTTKVTGTPVLTEGKPSSYIDTFTPEERRMQEREVKISKRKEKEEGSQNIRRTAKFAKSEAKSQGKSGKEARQVKRDVKSGKVTEGTKAALGSENADLARSEYLKSKWQGPISQGGKKYSKDMAEQAVATSGVGGKMAGANAMSGARTEYEYIKDGKKSQYEEGGKNVKATADVPEAKLGETSETKTLDQKTNASAEDNKNFSKYAGAIKSALKFKMLGFGSKSGYNFTSKKK